MTKLPAARRQRGIFLRNQAIESGDQSVYQAFLDSMGMTDEQFLNHPYEEESTEE